MFIVFIHIVNTLLQASRQSPYFGSLNSSGNLCLKVFANIDMPGLSQFKFCYVNGGRRRDTHKRLPDINNILDKHAPHGLFIAESLLDARTEKSLVHSGFNIEKLLYSTKEKRIWAAVRNDTPYKRRADLERKHIAAIWLEFGSGSGLGQG